MADDEKPQHIDDVLRDMRSRDIEEIENAFAHYEDFMSEEEQNRHYNEIFQPAMDDFYNTFKEELNERFEEDTAELGSDNREDVRRAVTEGLERYFEKTAPGVLEAIEDLELEGEDRFDYLTHHFAQHHKDEEGKGINIGNLVDEIIKKPDTTVGHLKRIFGERRQDWIKAGMQYLQSKAIGHYFHGFGDHEIAAHNKDFLEENDIEIDDKTKYLTAPKQMHVITRYQIQQDQDREEMYQRLGLKGAEEET